MSAIDTPATFASGTLDQKALSNYHASTRTGRDDQGSGAAIYGRQADDNSLEAQGAIKIAG